MSRHKYASYYSQWNAVGFETHGHKLTYGCGWAIIIKKWLEFKAIHQQNEKVETSRNLKILHSFCLLPVDQCSGLFLFWRPTSTLQKTFYRREALKVPAPLATTWSTVDCPVAFTLSAGHIAMLGFFVKPANSRKCMVPHSCSRLHQRFC